MACILGGATSFRSRRELKLLTRDQCILQTCTADVRLLRWSSMPLGFDSKDHPDRTAGVGVLPLVVSPTIRNLRVSKMLVDGGAGLNLFSTNVFRRLQIPDSELSPTGTFQGVCPGMTQPLGQITLPVTFGSPSNYRTEQVTFDIADTPLPYKRHPRTASAGQIHGRVVLRL